jgi:hypothetical protein
VVQPGANNIGLKGCSSHSGRRTFVTWAARIVHKAGGSLRDVPLLGGYRSIQTTQRYIDGDSDAQRRLVAHDLSAMVATITIRHRQTNQKNHLKTAKPSAAPIDHAVRIIHTVCGLAGSATWIDDIRADLRADKVQLSISVAMKLPLFASTLSHDCTVPSGWSPGGDRADGNAEARR